MAKEIEKKEINEDEQKEFNSVVEAVTEKTLPLLVEKMKAEMPLRKGIFGDGESSEKKELKEKQAQAAEYMKALVRGADTKALSAGSATNGAELVPTYVSDQFITVAQQYGLVRKYATHWPMQGIDENIPTLGSVAAYRLSSDTSPVTAVQPTTGAVQLRAKTVAAIVPVSKVLLQNSTIALVDALAYLCGKAIAKLEDQWGILGLCSGEGVFQTSGVPVSTMSSGNTTYAKATATNLLDVENLLDENFVAQDSNKLRWLMSRSVLNVFRRERSVVGTDNQGFLLPGYGVDTPPMLWSHPYDTSAIMPLTSDGSQTSKSFVALIDYENMIFGDAMNYSMEISDQATITDTDGSTLINLWQQNMVALKFWGLIDIQLSNPTKAFGLLKTAAS